MLLMLFYNPVITKRHEERKSIHFVFVRFSAWECTGSDQLWAGLVTTLCDRIENEFGLIPLSIYRALHKKIKKSSSGKEWVSKNILHFIPIWIFTICMFSLVLFGCVLISEGALGLMLGIVLSMFGICAVKPLITVFEVIKNLIVTQRVKVLRKLKTKDMSSQLGFMADVKKEIEIITSYLQLMEIFQKQKIRVIIEIIKLDNCMPNRVVEVLNAINILLSNPDAPFISILAVDPGIIVECVEKSDQLKGMANNGYLFLNRVVTLPFSIPQMNEKSISYHLNHIIDGKKTLIEYKKNSSKKSVKCELLCDVKVDSDNQDFKEQDQKANNLIKEAWNSLNSGICLKCITGNVINMRRLVTSIIITVRLMIKDNKNIKPDKVTKWVILAAQWPCSLSWILQCIEDEQQSRKSENSSYSNTFLWDVYEKSLETMHVNRKGLKQLLELDGDPDIFYDLLNDAKFTVEDANTFLPFTINLDCTIKRKIELLQGSYNFLRFKKEKILTRKFLLGMSTDAVCEKMSELNILPENLPQYRNLIKKNNLNGKALLYTDNKEIRKALGMNFGDWVEFSTNFLRLPTPNILF
ncbi:hypothetical protein GDO78_015616 [Eleutherodactylus coqui]|uniref:KAP NTPase domain-containing protein n=2 Tax=Eleutherodactylus coqui TaxID=57060 RepID=A0A8J6ENV9_ELECQ|nr:hypothetical protein GDO78_015616 [Eleutherodactylus coqui]